jgi:hypothetical protein
VAPGKSIQAYEDVLRLQKDVRPDFVIFDVSPTMFMEITPVFQRHFYGYSEDGSPLATFKLDDKGKLVYLPASPVWMALTVPPNATLESGAYIGTAFNLPEKDTPPEANKAWQVVEAILRQYEQEFPNTLFVIDGHYERARCAAQEGCAPRPIPSVVTGALAMGGPLAFENRLRGVCRAVSVVCSVPEPGVGESPFRQQMTYENDFHYTEFGNYWLADELAKDLASPLARHSN